MTEPVQSRWLDAQVAVIGSALLDETCVGPLLAHTTDDDFSETYRPIVAAMRALRRENRAVDPVTVKHRLGGQGALILEIMQNTPTAANFEAYMDCMAETSQMRRYQELGRALSQEAVTLDEFRDLADQIARVGLAHVKTAGKTQYQLLLEFFQRQGEKKAYLPMGLKWLDEHLYLDKGDFAILAGYPSDGKTALAIQMAFRQGREYRVGFFSLETSGAKVMDRIVANMADVELGAIKRHTLSDAELERIAAWKAECVGVNLEVVEAAGWTVARITEYAEQAKFDIIYIDYVQIIAPSRPADSRCSTVTEISQALHTFAQRTGTAVIGLSQLSRNKESRRPQLNMLRESGQLEQDADAVLFIWREKAGDYGKRTLTIAKNKEGETGDNFLRFDGAHQRFEMDAAEFWRRKNQAEKQAGKQRTPPPPQMSLLPDDEDNPFLED